MKKVMAVILFVVFLFSLCACRKENTALQQTEPKEEPKFETFAEYTRLDVFEDIPAMDMSNYSVVHEDRSGDDWEVIELKANVLPTYAELEKYVKTLESAGFTKYADNGKNGIDNAMFGATLTREDTVVSLTFITSTNTVYIAAAEKKPVSPHLVYDKAYVSGNTAGAKTTLTMHALYDGGNCYVIQLKNGHYIINDGGYQENTKMLVEYLTANAPNGEKPIVDAWFISHAHPDHAGVMRSIQLYNKEIVIEGVYYNISNTERSMGSNYDKETIAAIEKAVTLLRNSQGERTQLYRMHAGDRYYFNDISVEVLYTCEQVRESDLNGDINAFSLWLMYHIDGQKFLLNADTELANMRRVAQWFDRSYFDVDIMSVPHHGYNLYTDDFSFYRAKTLLYAQPYFMNNGWWSSERKTGNLEMQKYCNEIICWADGSKRLTFPYSVGSVETIPCWYPELVDGWIQNQMKWAVELGIAWSPAQMTQ